MLNTIRPYGLAEKLNSIKLMDDAVSAMHPIWQYIGILEFHEIKLAYEVTRPGFIGDLRRAKKPMRMYMAKSVAWRLLFAKKA